MRMSHSRSFNFQFKRVLESHENTSTPPHLSLDEVVALCPNMLQEPQDIDCAFVFYLLQHAVDHNVGARPAHASTGRKADTQLVHLLLYQVMNQGLHKLSSEPPTRWEITYVNYTRFSQREGYADIRTAFRNFNRIDPILLRGFHIHQAIG